MSELNNEPVASNPEEIDSKDSTYVEVILHHPDGTKETMLFSYIVGTGVIKDMEPIHQEDGTTKVAARSFEIGASSISERIGVHKCLMQQIDPVAILTGELTGTVRIESGGTE